MIILKGIIFDFNGTLFLDTPFHEQAWLTYAKKELNINLSKENYYKYMHGSTNPLIYEFLYKKPMPFELVDTFGQDKEVYYRELCRAERENLTLANGAKALLNFLEENNIPHAIATSSEITNVTFFKELFPLHQWFSDDRIIYDDGTVRGKPFPDLYLKAGARLGLPMKDLIVVEDAYSGVKAAKTAGAGMVIGICPDGKEHFVGTEYTDLVITDFTELDFGLFE